MKQPARPNSFERRDPATLKNHPLNHKIYGDNPSPDFLDATREGVNEPLLILPSSTVISGHKRRQAAIFHGHKVVPVIVRYDWEHLDPLEIEKLLILMNRSREKTTEQKAREYDHLRSIEASRAENRKAATQFGTVPQKSAAPQKPEKKGDSRKLAAETVGLSHDTAEKAVEVVQKIDEAESKGDTAKASELRETLESNVSAAHRKATEPETPEEAPTLDATGNPVPQHLVEIFQTRVVFATALVKLKGVVEAINSIPGETAGVLINASAFLKDVGNIRRAIRFAMPHAVCPYCKAKREACVACKGQGWVGESAYDNAPAEMRV